MYLSQTSDQSFLVVISHGLFRGLRPAFSYRSILPPITTWVNPLCDEAAEWRSKVVLFLASRDKRDELLLRTVVWRGEEGRQPWVGKRADGAFNLIDLSNANWQWYGQEYSAKVTRSIPTPIPNPNHDVDKSIIVKFRDSP